jgi:hypothetical protein
MEYKSLLFVNPPASAKEEPTKASNTLADALESLLKQAETGTFYRPTGNFQSGHLWRGFHIADDGERSLNYDFCLPSRDGRRAFVTNSLAPHYVRYYYNWLPDSEVIKLAEVCKLLQSKHLI